MLAKEISKLCNDKFHKITKQSSKTTLKKIHERSNSPYTISNGASQWAKLKKGLSKLNITKAETKPHIEKKENPCERQISLNVDLFMGQSSEMNFL